MQGNLGKGKEIDRINVLSVGLEQEDSSGLAAILGSQSPIYPDSDWKLQTSASLRSAMSLLEKDRPHIVVCEKSLGKDSWRDLLDRVCREPDPPALIVASRVADDYLWAEALNLGAYDVLAAPFEPAEVMRVLSSAWLHRMHRKEAKIMRSGMSTYLAAS
jgi:DNA-binding NtrC family response regulator